MNESGGLADRHAEVRARIAEAATSSGREASAVRLIAVTKRLSPERIEEAAELGLTDFGESYLQEALPKVDAFAGRGLCWHFVGRLQSNKARRAAERFDWLHGVDGLRTARAVSRAMVTAERTARVFVEIHLGGGAVRGGLEAGDAARFLEDAATLAGIRFVGVMGIAPRDGEARPHFERLRLVAERLRGLGIDNAPMNEMSAGMSGDYEDAIREGATMVRLGTTLFGPRPD